MQSRVVAQGSWLAGVLLAGSAHAGSYLHSEGATHYVGTVGYTTATQGWDRDGDTQDLGCRSEYSSFSHYLEHGYSYYHTVFGQTSLAQSRCGDEDKAGLGEVRVGIRGRLNRYLNDRAWEIEATIPSHRDHSGRSRLGCGSFGLGARVARRDRTAQGYAFSREAGLQFWEQPLAHQFVAKVAASGPVASHWNWTFGLSSELPISDGAIDPDAVFSDCGTEAKVLRGNASVRFGVSPVSSVSCGTAAALWGEDVSRSRGFYCGYSYLWD